MDHHLKNCVGSGTWFLATSPNSHPQALEQLSKVAPIQVLIQIATNPRTSKSTLAKLAEHEDAEVRSSVAENENTPTEVIWNLSRDSNPDVRYLVAENHNIAIEILKALCEDENPYVASRAVRTIERIIRERNVGSLFGTLNSAICDPMMPKSFVAS